ncbi:MAG: hypothetical protein IPH38_09115 [Candidatus Microthrix sp.]|nr:hypothetical protein [Candidatus Microthrix sp.]MBK7019734.1 hypothetical protein [Candidatus Microthrix sp.]
MRRRGAVREKPAGEWAGVTFPSITNRGEFFSNHYLDAVSGGDLGDLRKAWDEAEGKGEPSARSTLKGAASRFFKTRATASEATGDRATAAVEHLNDVVLQALGFDPNRNDLELTRNTTDRLTIRAAATAETGTGLWLVAIDAGLADSADDLFDDGPATDDEPAAGRLLNEGLRHGDKKHITSAADAVGELFAVDEPPRYVLVLGGRIVLLAERAKWAEGRYLAVDLDAALERNDAKAKGRGSKRSPPCSQPARSSPAAPTATAPKARSTSWSTKSHKHAVRVSRRCGRASRQHRDPRQRGHRPATQNGQGRLQHRNGYRRQRADQPVPALPLPAVGVALRRVPPRAGHRARQ